MLRASVELERKTFILDGKPFTAGKVAQSSPNWSAQIADLKRSAPNISCGCLNLRRLRHEGCYEMVPLFCLQLQQESLDLEAVALSAALS